METEANPQDFDDAAEKELEAKLASIFGLARGFDHGPMKTVSLQFQNSVWEDWHGKPLPVPALLQKVSAIFVALQRQRHSADYNNSKHWEVSEVEDLIVMANDAFSAWASIRIDPMAGNYLLAMLLKKR